MLEESPTSPHPDKVMRSSGPAQPAMADGPVHVHPQASEPPCVPGGVHGRPQSPHPPAFSGLHTRYNGSVESTGGCLKARAAHIAACLGGGGVAGPATTSRPLGSPPTPSTGPGASVAPLPTSGGTHAPRSATRTLFRGGRRSASTLHHPLVARASDLTQSGAKVARTRSGGPAIERRSRRHPLRSGRARRTLHRETRPQSSSHSTPQPRLAEQHTGFFVHGRVLPQSRNRMW